jgi:hypothetical protein
MQDLADLLGLATRQLIKGEFAELTLGKKFYVKVQRFPRDVVVHVFCTDWFVGTPKTGATANYAVATEEAKALSSDDLYDVIRLRLHHALTDIHKLKPDLLGESQ